MASAWVEEESFACPVCLETLKDPATLPCGHSYCLCCIQSHWDKRDNKGQYSCPQCRQVFNPRPSLAKSTLLVEAMEKLRANSLKLNSFSTLPSMPAYLEVQPSIGPRQGSVYPQLPTLDPRPCPRHNQPLDLFCQEDKENVCEECCQHEHKGHKVVKPEDERKERQKEVVQMQSDVQMKIKETERTLKELPHAARQHKALVQALEKESTDLFSDLVKNVNVTGIQVGELLSIHESALGSQVECQIHKLEQEVAQLHWKTEELSRLADMQDHMCFLKNFFTMDPLGQMNTSGESVLSQEEALIGSVRSVLRELQVSIQDLCKTNLDKIASLLNQDSRALVSNSVEPASSIPADESSQASTKNIVYEGMQNPPPLPPPRPDVDTPSISLNSGSVHGASAPPLPIPSFQPQAPSAGVVKQEPTTRYEMLKFRFEPTLDPNTAYRHVQLTDGGRKATLKAENLNPPDHPDRFQFWRQVLCEEPLGGSPYYWEVEWTGQKVTIGVAHKEIERKGSDDKSRLGHNALSWSLYWSGTGFSFWHDGQEKLLGSPKVRRIGVYLDQQVGVLAFYGISHNEAHLIHRHQTQFNGPLYPGFRFWSGAGSAVTICSLD